MLMNYTREILKKLFFKTCNCFLELKELELLF